MRDKKCTYEEFLEFLGPTLAEMYENHEESTLRHEIPNPSTIQGWCFIKRWDDSLIGRMIDIMYNDRKLPHLVCKNPLTILYYDI